MKKCAAYYIVLFFILIQNSYAQFIDFTNESGVFFIGNNSMWGNGISAIDFNLDGFDDLTIGSDIGIACYQSNGDGSFEMVHFIYLNTHVLQVLWVDYDNDFDLDLFATSYGDGIFLYERTEGLEFTDPIYSANTAICTPMALAGEIMTRTVGKMYLFVNMNMVLVTRITPTCFSTTTRAIRFKK